MGAALAVAALGTTVAQATPNTTQYANPAKSSPGVSNATVSGAKTKSSAPKTVAPTQSAVSPPKSTLPFTGLDLLVFALAGGALIVTGLGLRRIAASRARK
jgi:hypothetical protein